MPTVYTVEQVLADPIQLNSRLGTYTNFVNLLDLCGLAVPAAMRADGAPSASRCSRPAGHDALLASIGRVFHADTGLPLGATGARAAAACRTSPRTPQAGEIALAVVGAHLSGMPLNGELQVARRALSRRRRTTAPDYRLFALAARSRRSPGCCGSRTARARRSRWRSGRCRRTASAASSPRSRRRWRSARCGSPTARSVKGFLVEADGVDGARDISSFGGWRAFVADKR